MMSSLVEDLIDAPPLTALLAERERPRLRGIPDWEVAASLGRQNLERRLALTREHANALLTEGGAREELRRLRAGRERLETLAQATTPKPILPRLRNEVFHVGQDVRIYMGDTPGVLCPPRWVQAVITEVRKGYRSDWDDGLPNGGWHWRVTAGATIPVFTSAPQKEIAFSTSEPRAILETEWAYLQNAATNDPLFFAAYCTNADRELVPLWCLERGLSFSTSSIDLPIWLNSETN